MKKIILLDPLGNKKGMLSHRHLLRDWSGTYIPGYIPFPPLDLLFLASYLRKYGYDAKIIEGSARHLLGEDLVEIIKAYSADYVFLPTTYFSLDDDKYLANLIRGNVPGTTKIIFAGPSVTYDPSLVLQDNTADFVALGEFELPVLNIIKGEYDENIAFKKDGKIISGKRTLIDPGELPTPARDLINNNLYRYAIFNKRNPVTTMMISRGCPHSKCNFCHSVLYSLGYVRYRNIESIIEEINDIVFKYKIGEIFFRDQAFTANRELVFNLCNYLISNNIDILWRATTRVDLVDEELLSLMNRAGCYQISFGFESGSQKVLDKNSKGITVEQSRKAARWAKKSGIEVLGLFMLGMPGDSDKSAKELFKFITELDIDYLSINDYFLFPGAPIYDEYIADKASYLPRKLMNTSPVILYLCFYLRPKYLLKQIKKIKSGGDLVFLVKTGLKAFLSYF